MAYKQSVTVNARRATASAVGANLSNSLFIATHAAFNERIYPFYSASDVASHAGITSDMHLYKALTNAFGATGGSAPIWVGRKKADEIVFTPDVNNSKEYTFKIESFNESTNTSEGSWTISFTSDTDATAAEISAGIDAAIGAASIPATELTSADEVGSVRITAAANRNLVITDIELLTLTYVSVESMTDAYNEIYAENKSDWYFVTSESRNWDDVEDLGDAVEASENSNYPKQYRVSDNSIFTLTTQTDPSNVADIMGRIEDSEWTRTSGHWHHDSTEDFPELKDCVKVGGASSAGTMNWKFLQNTATLARHPEKGRLLTDAELGFILDRNASVYGEEMGLNFMLGGTNATGTSEYTDLVQTTDWIRITMKARVLTALVNANNGNLPLTMTSGDLDVIKERMESVLIEAVDMKVLAGFEPIVMPTSIPFEDQATRLLDNLKFTAYFAAKVNFVVIDGVLTYKEEIA